MNELQTIKEMLRVYKNPRTEEKFLEARKYLNKKHKQYGTIDPGSIKELIN